MIFFNAIGNNIFLSYLSKPATSLKNIENANFNSDINFAKDLIHSMA